MELKRLSKREELSDSEKALYLVQADEIENNTMRLVIAIQTIPGLQGIILMRHYIVGEKIEDIARDIHYTPRQAYRINNTAVDALLNIINVSECQ